MARQNASASPSTPNSLRVSAPSATLEKPVPGASKNTRSDWTSSVQGLSSTTQRPTWEVPLVTTRRGPTPPKLMGTLAQPGPPLKQNVTGRDESGSPSPMAT